jgi:hypothetical protein
MLDRNNSTWNVSSAIHYFTNQINNAIRLNYSNKNSLDDYDVEICKASSETFQLPGFLDDSQVNAVIVPKWQRSFSKNCIISFLFVKEYNESNVKSEALKQLLSLSIKSKYPVLHVITDFNRYQLSFIYFDDNDKTYYLCESILNKSLKVILKIIFWLDNYYVSRESNGFVLENGIKISIDGLIKAKTNIINIAKTKANQIENQN